MTAREIFQSQFGRDIGISPKTARNWLDLLVHSYQWVELPAYSPAGGTRHHSLRRQRGLVHIGSRCRHSMECHLIMFHVTLCHTVDLAVRRLAIAGSSRQLD